MGYPLQTLSNVGNRCKADPFAPVHLDADHRRVLRAQTRTPIGKATTAN